MATNEYARNVHGEQLLNYRRSRVDPCVSL